MSGLGLWVALAMVSSVVAAGCSQVEEPDVASTTSTSAAQSDEPSPSDSAPPEVPAETPPPMPTEAQVADADGAAAFIRHYFDVVNYAYRTGDVVSLNSLEVEECESCGNVTQAILDGHQNGRSIEGGHIAVGDVVATPGDPKIGLEIRAVIDQARGAYLSPTGAVEQAIEVQDNYLFGALIQYDGQWKIREWGDANELL